MHITLHRQLVRYRNYQLRKMGVGTLLGLLATAAITIWVWRHGASSIVLSTLLIINALLLLIFVIDGARDTLYQIPRWLESRRLAAAADREPFPASLLRAEELLGQLGENTITHPDACMLAVARKLHEEGCEVTLAHGNPRRGLLFFDGCHALSANARGDSETLVNSCPTSAKRLHIDDTIFQLTPLDISKDTWFVDVGKLDIGRVLLAELQANEMTMNTPSCPDVVKVSRL